MIILAIESSCDETGVAILEVQDGHFTVRANQLYSQIAMHQKTQGVVPEVAARAHVEWMPKLLEGAFAEAKLTKDDLDLIAVTRGPGLNGSLVIGTACARTLSYATGKPLIGINHLRAHIQSNFFNIETGTVQTLAYPALALLVSGGHTELVIVRSPTDFALIGQTLDDAVGESYDKVARLLGLPYPGGPAVAARAEKGDPQAFPFPVAMKQSGNLNFSYSGLKTAVRDAVHKQSELSETVVNDMCASFQYAAIEQLMVKTLAAVEQYGAQTVLIAGGVSANTYLRSQLKERLPKNVALQIPPFFLCTDNALMVAMAAYLEYTAVNGLLPLNTWETLKTDPALNI